MRRRGRKAFVNNFLLVFLFGFVVVGFFRSDIKVYGWFLCLNAAVLDQSRDCEVAMFYPWYFQEHEQERASGGFLYGVVNMCGQRRANYIQIRNSENLLSHQEKIVFIFFLFA